jgi:hypothetical protein
VTLKPPVFPIALPAQNVAIQRPTTEIDPIWYQKLLQMAAVLNSGSIGVGTLATSATAGFGFLPTMAGAPTGVPIALPGFVPCVFDTTNNKLWIYNGTWKGVVLT